jgi:acylglycerol lipase
VREPRGEAALRAWALARGMTWERIAYRRAEAGGWVRAISIAPPAPQRVVVTVHGTGNDALYPLAGVMRRLLEDGAAVFAFDLDGHGRESSTRFAPATMPGAVPDAIRRAADLHPGLPLHLVGESFGGALALAALAEPPVPVRSAAVAAAPIRLRLGVAPVVREVAALASPDAAHLCRYYGGWGALPAFGPFKRRRFPVRLARGARILGYLDAVQQTLALLDIPATLGAVETPVLLIQGGSDPVVPAETGHRLERCLPRGVELRLPGLGHCASIASPRTEGAIAEWIAGDGAESG